MDNIINCTKLFCTLLGVAILHSLGLSSTARDQDFKTAMRIALVKSYGIIFPPGKLTDSQQNSLHDDTKTDQIHIVPTKLPLPSDTNLVDMVATAIKSLGNGDESFSRPNIKSVSGEWIGHRKFSSEATSYSHEDGYMAMMKDVKGGPTILYLHGGQFWRKGRTPRDITHTLAKETAGRCLAVYYKLAPQNPFPSAITEGLAAYLSLLYPPAGSCHSAIQASEICFAGDSAGGNIVISLLQLILEINRISQTTSSKLRWNGEHAQIPVPAGVAALSPYTDMTRALRSETQNLKYDIILARGPPFADFTQCEVWPAYPPRHHVYAEDNALLHPLVSPVTVQDWSGAPPVWICVGEECLADQGMFVAQRMASQGVAVVLEQYATMPHNFPFVAPEASFAKKCCRHWGSFIGAVVKEPETVTTVAVRWSGNPLVQEKLDIDNLVPVSQEDLKDKMRNEIRKWGAPPSRRLQRESALEGKMSHQRSTLLQMIWSLFGF